MIERARSNYGHSGVIDATYAWVRKELGRDVKFFVEVGSFHGNSAAVWGRNIKGSGVLLCIGEALAIQWPVLSSKNLYSVPHSFSISPLVSLSLIFSLLP